MKIVHIIERFSSAGPERAIIAAAKYAAQLDTLTRAYGEMVLKRWPLMYTSQSSGHLQGMLRRAGALFLEQTV